MTAARPLFTWLVPLLAYHAAYELTGRHWAMALGGVLVVAVVVVRVAMLPRKAPGSGTLSLVALAAMATLATVAHSRFVATDGSFWSAKLDLVFSVALLVGPASIGLLRFVAARRRGAPGWSHFALVAVVATGGCFVALVAVRTLLGLPAAHAALLDWTLPAGLLAAGTIVDTLTPDVETDALPAPVRFE